MKWGFVLAKTKSSSTCICGRACNTTVLNRCGQCEHSCQVFSALEFLRPRSDPFIHSVNKHFVKHLMCVRTFTKHLWEPLELWVIHWVLGSSYFQIMSFLVFWKIVKNLCYGCLLKFYLFATFWNEAHSPLGFIKHHKSHSGYFFKTHKSAQPLRNSLLGLIKEN